MDALTFATGLLDRGIELVLRNGRLHVWPGRAHKYGLTDAERAFIQQHRDELKQLAASKVLPEATVVWSASTLPREVTAPPAGTGGRPTVAPAPACAYCGRPCVGPDHHAYTVLHYLDPSEVARRDTEATSVMRKMVRRSEC